MMDTSATSEKRQISVYLAGPINACSDDEAMSWRAWFKNTATLPNAIFLDPMKRDYRGNERECYREIVDLDKMDIRKCDVFVLMYVAPSVGTSMETFYAWTIGKPVLVVNESHAVLSPWLIYHSTAIVDSKIAAVKKINEWT
jgi:nucleoside 2-deoxyribosyltransferase